MFQLDNKMLESVSGGWGRRNSSSGNVRKTSIKSNYSLVVASGNFISKGGSMTIIVTQNIGDNNFNEESEQPC